MSRATDIDHLYTLLETLDDNVGGPRTLDDCTGRMDWPKRGVYIFLNPAERHGGDGYPRVTRVGTHAVSAGSGTAMWDRLRTHRGAMRGSYEGGGNHRGSVFRERVGEAVIERDGLGTEYPEWGAGSTADRDRRLAELPLERRVSEYIRDLPFLWVAVDDEPGPESDRAYLEQQLLALLSNYEREAIDPRREGWLGHHSRHRKIRESGLWNIGHVEESYDPDFLSTLEAYDRETPPV